jgi:hypothetical protein
LASSESAVSTSVSSSAVKRPCGTRRSRYAGNPSWR